MRSQHTRANTSKRLLLPAALLAAAILFALNSSAQPQKGQRTGPDDVLLSLPDIMPMAYVYNSQPKGFLIDLAKAMDRVYQEQGVTVDGQLRKGRVIVTGVFPFPRSIENVKTGAADFHMPFLVNPFFKAEAVERSEGFAYSTAYIFNVVFAMYANHEFAQEVHAFENSIGKKLQDFSPEEYAKFDGYVKSKNRKIGVDRAHTNFYLFNTQQTSSNAHGLMMVAAGRLDAYIHSFDECDKELQKGAISSERMEKILYKKFFVRMVIPPGEKGKRADQVVSGLIWSLQGRKPSDIALSDLPDAGKSKEVPDDRFFRSPAFKNSEYYKMLAPVFDPVFTSEIPK